MFATIVQMVFTAQLELHGQLSAQEDITVIHKLKMAPVIPAPLENTVDLQILLRKPTA
jgi:hypothetical protein